MNTVEEFIVILGISLDVFAIMECHGSVIAKIHKKRLLAFCLLLMLGQAAALGTGDSISLLLCKNRVGIQDVFLEQAVAAAIFLCLGMRLFTKAWQNERIAERREDHLNFAELRRFYIRTILFTLLAGLGFGLMQSKMDSLWLMILGITAAVTVLGIYTGYRLGFEHKVKAYLAGGVLLVIGGMDIVLKYMIRS